MIKNLVLTLVLLLSMSVGAEVELPIHIDRPSEVCVNGVVYYIVREWSTNGPRAAGYGYFAHKIDDVTLQPVRCRRLSPDINIINLGEK